MFLPGDGELINFSSPSDRIRVLGPQLWYRFDEPVGATSGINHGLLGSSYNAPYTSCVLAQPGPTGAPNAAFFNGDTSLMSIPAGAYADYPKTTIAILLKMTGVGESSAARLWNFGTLTAEGRAVTNAANHIQGRRGASTAVAISQTNWALQFGVWTWVFYTFDNVGDRLIHWFCDTNGIVAEPAYDGGRAAAQGTLTALSTLPWCIGNDSTAARGYCGYVGQLMLWNSILTLPQMQSIVSGWSNTGGRGGEVSLAFLSDTQSAAFVTPLTWVANTADNLFPDAAATLHGGDICGDALNPAHWATMNTALTPIEAANKPFLFAAGNHDADDSAHDFTQFNAAGHLPTTRYTAKSWWNGGFKDAGHSENAYFLFSGAGHDWIILSLEYAPNTAVVTWANSILTTYTNRKAIILTHAYLGPTGTRYSGAETYNPHTITGPYPNFYDGQELWDECLKLHANVVLVLCGHDAVTTPQYSVDTGVNGNRVHQLLWCWHQTGMSTYVRMFVIGKYQLGIYTYNGTTWIQTAANQFEVAW